MPWWVQDADAELPILIDIWMIEGSSELEGRRGVGIIRRECHGGFEVATVVKGGRVEDHERDRPVGYGFINELFFVLIRSVCALPGRVGNEEGLTSIFTHFSCERALNSFIRMRSVMLEDSTTRVYNGAVSFV